MRAAPNNRTILKYIAIALVAVFVVSVSFLLLGMWEKKQGTYPEADVPLPTLEYDGQKYVLREDIETFLVLGLDKFEGDASVESYNNDKQADFLLLYVFDKNAKKYSAIHINRDTMTDVAILDVLGLKKVSTVTQQIALAHTQGNGREVSCRNVADSVSGLLLGAKIDHFVSVTMDAVPKFNDLVGGVEVEVLEDFTGIDDTLVKGERITLMGEHALNYVRTRYGLDDSTNSTRMQRQKQYLDALREKTEKLIKEDEEFVVRASVEMSEHIVSDRSVTQLQELARKMSDYEFTKIYTLEGKNIKGEKFIEFYPDADSLKKTVIELFYTPKD